MATVSPLPALNTFSVAQERAAQLESDIVTLDKEYQIIRDNMVSAIAALRRTGAAPTIPVGRTPKSPKRAPKDVDRRKAVDEALTALPAKFNTSEVTQYIVSNYPSLAPLLKKSYVSMRLEFLSKQGKIKKVESGQRGEPSTWSKI